MMVELNNNNCANYRHTNKLHFGTVIIILLSIITMVMSNTIISLPVVSLAQVNSIPVNPFETRGVPPQIVMEYGGKEYPGKLIRYIANISTTNSSSTGGSGSQSLGGEGTLTAPTSSDNITSPLPNQIITVKKDSSVNFIIRGNNTPTKAQPNTMSVTAYNIKGMAVKLLNTTQQAGTKNMVVVNLDKGQYILLSVATWLPQKGSNNNNKNTIIGFVSYSYRINVVS